MVRIQKLFQKKIRLTITDVIEESKKLAKYIENKTNIKDIYGVPNGGYFIAIELSKHLNLPLTNFPTRDTLIVDDLIDSGKTLRKYPNNWRAVLYVKNNRHKEVHFWVRSVEEWIVFPWERKKNKIMKVNK